MKLFPAQILPHGGSLFPKGARYISRGAAGLALSMAALGGGHVLAAENARPEQPGFVRFNTGSVDPSRVHHIVSSEVTDLVMVPAGYDSGYRPGMVCRVTREGEAVAEILMVEVRDRVSAGIIVSIFSDRVIEPDDVVRVKTVQYQP